MNRANRPDGCVCLADQYERFGHRDYCDEQTQLTKFEAESDPS